MHFCLPESLVWLSATLISIEYSLTQTHRSQVLVTFLNHCVCVTFFITYRCLYFRKYPFQGVLSSLLLVSPLYRFLSVIYTKCFVFQTSAAFDYISFFVVEHSYMLSSPSLIFSCLFIIRQNLPSGLIGE